MFRSPASSLTLHAIRGERVRMAVMTAIAVLYALANVVGYRQAYPTRASREEFARAFSDNIALRLFYGIPHDLASVGGYVEFRAMGMIGILGAAWMVFAAVRALRGEEESGCFELILAGTIGRGGALAAVLAALALECAFLYVVLAVVLLASATAPGDMTAGESLLVAAGSLGPALVFAAVGALAAQLAPTRRSAQAGASAALAAALFLRIAADIGHGIGWVRWTTPIGWDEQLRPVTGARPAVLLLFAVAAVVLAVLTLAVARGRDVDSSIIHARGHTRSRLALLGSPTLAAVRSELPRLIGWLVATGLFAFALGAFARSVTEEVRKVSIRTYGLTITTATGYLAAVFALFALVVALYAASRIGSLRDEESSGRLETLFALPVARRSWIGGRLALAAGTTVVLSLATGVLAWAGAVVTNGDVSLGDMLAAGANCIAAALLFLGLGALLFAWVPRPSPGAAMGLVAVAFLWELVGALVGAPWWLLTISPFHHVTQVPLVAADRRGTAIMLIVAAVAAAGSVERFARRDLKTG
jgi:polyether ionophore transport system permease protein